MPNAQEIIDAVSSRLPKRGCPSCGGRAWDITPNVLISSLFSPEEAQIDTEHGAPTAVAVCKNCGLFLNYGAVRLGLIKAGEQSDGQRGSE